MEQSTKHTLEHVGDIVVERLEKVLEWLSTSTKGVSLTYRIHCLEKDKEKSYARIGKCTVTLRARNPHNELFSDEDLKQLFDEFDKVDGDLSNSKSEREARLYPKMQPDEQPV